MSSVSPGPQGRLRWLLRAVLVAASSVAIVFLFLVLGVRLIVVPNIGSFRDDITRLIAKGVGRNVSIGTIDAGWNGWSPTLTLSDFKLFDPGGREALALPSIQTSVSWQSVLIGEIRLGRLDVSGAELLIRRDAQGRIHIGGLDMEQHDQEDPGVADWFIKQSRVTIRDATLVWLDELRGAPPLKLERVNLLIENSGSKHRFGLAAIPPATMAAPIEVRGEVTLRSMTELAQAPGKVYARLDYADVAAWKPWLPLPFELRSGRGALRGWADFEAGEIRDVTLDVELDDVRTRLKPALPELDLVHLSGRMTWRQEAEQTDFGTRGLQLIIKGGNKLAPGDITVRHVAPRGDKAAIGEIKSSRLQLEPVLALVQFLPIDEKVRVRLAKFAPVGTLETGSYSWTGPLDAPLDYDLRAQFRGLGVNAVESLPGITRVTGNVEATARAGSIHLTADGSRLVLPHVFAAPVEVDALALQASWKVAEQIAVKIGRLSFANADIAGSAQGDYRTLDKGPGHIDLSGTLLRMKGPAVFKYMPITMAPGIRNWLRGAIAAGTATDARFVVRGNLYEFPFAGQQGGLFEIKGKVTEGALNYSDLWPGITDIKADLLFEGSRMEIVASEAMTAGVQLGKVKVEIPDMGAIPSRLVIQGEAAGRTESFLDYVEHSPVGKWIGHFTQGAKATGSGRLNLGLDIALGKFEDTKVNGEYTFAANTIQLGNDIPRLDKAAGRLTFNEREFRARDVNVEAFGGAAVIEVAVADGKTRVAATGTADVAEVRKAYPFPLAEQLRGRTDWQFNLQTDGGVAAWSVESGLRGIASDLPPPLAKKAEQTLPLKLERQAIDRTHDRLTASIGTIAGFEAVRVLSDKHSEIQRLAFSFGRATGRADRDGFWIRGNVDNLELEPWLALAGAGATGAGTAGDKIAGGSELALSGVDLQADSLLAFGRRFRNLNMQVRSQPGAWRIDLDSADIAGNATWQVPRSGDTGKLTARLRRLALPAEDAPHAAPAPARRELPALDVVADSYVSKGRDLGRLELAAKPEGADWRIETLALRNPESDLAASGRWRAQGAMQRTDMEVKLEVRDAGRFLARHGVPDGVKGGSGTLEGKLNWVGGPQDFDYPTLNGQFNVDIARGQFTKVDPGIGKLLGILNLDALARRLRFDFKDVTAEGYSFDGLAGDVAVRNGVMSTSNLRIVGPAAKVEISGEADIARETQHLKIRVQPALSGGLAAAAAAATVNPIIGAGVLLGSTILKDPIGKMFAGEYDVTGAWVNPKVDPVGAGKRGTPGPVAGSSP